MRCVLIGAVVLSLATPTQAGAPIGPPEHATLRVRGAPVEWTSRYRYSDLTHLMVRIDGRAPMEEAFEAGGDPCGAYFYLRGVAVRLHGCSPGRRRQIRVRARGVGPNAHTVTVRFAGPRA